MSYVRWEVVPGSRRSDGERAVAECRVSTWHSEGQRLCRPQTGSVACHFPKTVKNALTQIDLSDYLRYR